MLASEAGGRQKGSQVTEISDRYHRSFGRNIGILTLAEQEKLAESTVAVVGTGGVGGNVAILLARMGVGRFRIADFDKFELANINRQYGAATDTVGQQKADVVAADIARINPAAEIQVFPEGFTEENADALLAGADIAIDAIDFYAIETHLKLHAKTREHGLFTIMGSPIGFSACLQVFDPDGMGLAEYCGIGPDMDPLEKQMRYACGLVPELAHIDYYDVSTADSNTDFSAGTGPSLACACGIASGLVATETSLILLGRRATRAIPHTFQFDPYMFRYAKTFIPGGMQNYDPAPAIERMTDRSSLVPQVLDFLYGKAQAERIAVNDARIFCREEGSGEPVVFISPLGGDSSFWARQVPVFAESFRVITFDARGTGISTPCPDHCSVEELASDLIGLLDHLNVRSAHLVGLAIGGLVALEVAALRPDLARTLVIASSYEAADDRLRQLTGRWRELARTGGMEVLFEECLNSVFSPAYIEQNRAEMDKLKTFFRLTMHDPESFCQLSLAGVSYDTQPILPKISTPTLVLHGGQDRVIDPDHAKQLAAGIPEARLTEIPDGSHFMPYENAEAFNAAVLSFIRLAASAE